MNTCFTEAWQWVRLDIDYRAHLNLMAVNITDQSVVRQLLMFHRIILFMSCYLNFFLPSLDASSYSHHVTSTIWEHLIYCDVQGPPCLSVLKTNHFGYFFATVKKLVFWSWMLQCGYRGLCNQSVVSRLYWQIAKRAKKSRVHYSLTYVNHIKEGKLINVNLSSGLKNAMDQTWHFYTYTLPYMRNFMKEMRYFSHIHIPNYGSMFFVSFSWMKSYI